MAGQNYILNINNPCQQDWSRMQPGKEGRFCVNCSKAVIDFANLSDGQILQKIKERNGKICGRISKSQISRPLIAPDNSSFYSKLYKFLTGILIFSGPKITNAASLQIQNEQIEIHEQEIENFSEETKDQDIQNVKDTIPNTIEGKLVDAETNEPLPYANVFIRNTEKGVITDLEGNFKLTIPPSLLYDSIHIQFVCIGYGILDTIFYKKDLPVTASANLIIKMEGGIILGEICVTKEKKHKRKRKQS